MSEVTGFDALWPALLRKCYQLGPDALREHLAAARAREPAALPEVWAQRIYNAALLLVDLRARCGRGAEPVASPAVHERIVQCIAGGEPSEGLLVEREHALDANAWLFEEAVLSEALSRALRNPAEHAVFLQYLRIRTALYTRVVHDPAEIGLSAYRACSNRAKALRTWLDASTEVEADWARDAIDQAANERDIDVRAIELRTGVARAPLLAERLSERSQDTAPEIGVVAIFVRRRASGRTLIDAARDYSDSLPSLEQAFRSHAALVGIDVAGDETGEPAWVVAPFIAELRRRVGRRVPLTVHLSETFSGPIAGLRQLAEPLVYRLLENRDRVGHGVAAGLDLERLARRQSTVLQTRLERLWDLAFLHWARHAWAGDTEQPDAYAAFGRYADDEARTLSSKELREPMDTAQSARLWEGLAAERGWQALLTDREAPKYSELLRRVLQRYDGFPPRLPVPIREPEVRLLPWLQGKLLEAFAARQVTIELNPTSNLLTQGFDIPVDQPRFRPPAAYPRLTITPDCPRAFATSIGTELLLARAGLHLGGVGESEVNAWIAAAIDHSWECRFRRFDPRAAV